MHEHHVNVGAGVSRRAVLKWSGAAGMLALTGALPACAPSSSGASATDLVLADGFIGRIVARGGEIVPGTNYRYPIFPDGAATFADAEVPGGWFYTVNHEIPGAGGVSSLRFAPDGTVVDAFSIARNTSLNCAGGATPWGTWLTCEEFDWGTVWECDPTRPSKAIRRPALGAFAHEAAAVAQDGRIYLTEDRRNGAFYRFTPTAPQDLSAGLLEVACGSDQVGSVTWVEVPDPAAQPIPCHDQVPNTIHYSGGEGVDTDGDLVWFTTKGDNSVWEYSLTTESIRLRYRASAGSILKGVDNLLADRPSGRVLIAEDGDDMQIVTIAPDDTLSPIAQLHNHPGSEMTGPTFSPDGKHLFFSSQRGPVGSAKLPFGVTYQVTGPWDQLLDR